MDYEAGLNQRTSLLEQLERALDGATRLELAVAYAKTSGVGPLLRRPPPRGSRAVVGLGFGLSDPPAVEQLASARVDVRVVVDSSRLAASQFHPKLYMASRPGQLVVLSGSGNLTGGGLVRNVEQYERLLVSDPSAEADLQRQRFEQLWDHGTALDLLRRSGDWEEYRQRARDRRVLEQQDRQRLLRLHARTGRLVGHLARRDTRGQPGYIGITDPGWWKQQLLSREQSDTALYWRGGGSGVFQALAEDGLFFHLLRADNGREEARNIAGFSRYPGLYETGSPDDLWRRYGERLGVTSLEPVFRRLGVERGRTIGVIHLRDMTEFDRSVTLEELRSNGISFASNIVGGKSVNLEEVATILELGGLGVADDGLRAAERPGPYQSDGDGS